MKVTDVSLHIHHIADSINPAHCIALLESFVHVDECLANLQVFDLGIDFALRIFLIDEDNIIIVIILELIHGLLLGRFWPRVIGAIRPLEDTRDEDELTISITGADVWFTVREILVDISLIDLLKLFGWFAKLLFQLWKELFCHVQWQIHSVSGNVPGVEGLTENDYFILILGKGHTNELAPTSLTNSDC